MSLATTEQEYMDACGICMSDYDMDHEDESFTLVSTSKPISTDFLAASTLTRELVYINEAISESLDFDLDFPF